MSGAVLAVISGALLLLWATVALCRRRGGMDRISALYAIAGLLGSEWAPLLASIDLALLALAWALGAADHGFGRVGLALQLLALAGFALAWVRGLGTAARIAAVTGVPVRSRLQPARWWRPMRFADARVRVERDLVYGDPDEPLHRLDLLKPVTPPAGLMPVLINIHGGGWLIGKKGQQALPLMNDMAASGWLVIDANYRLSPQVAMPGHLIDVKRVIAWARQHAAAHGGDAGRLVLTGGSAGGHLVTLAALTAGRSEFQPGFEAVDTAVQLCVSFYGKYDFLGRRAPDPGFAAMLVEQKIMPAASHEAAALWQAMDPASQIHADAPPFVLLHGTHDGLFPVEEGRWFAERLRAVSRQAVHYIEIPGAHHAWDVPHSLRSQHTAAALSAFAAHHLQDPRPAAA